MTSGPPFLRPLLVMAALLIVIDAVNVMTALSDSARYGAHLAAWQPIVWESTSGLATLAAAIVPWLALGRAWPGRAPIGRLLLIHLVASVAFSAIHIGLMAAARWGIYAAVGEHYSLGPSEWLYEYRKDLLSYLLLAGVFWLSARRAAPAAENATLASAEPPTFDIVDGPNLTRVRLSEILAVQAAGNYVEFVLAGRRTALMRAPLRLIEQRLQGDGFVRTHRSWLVNIAAVRAILAAGSGDFDLQLEDGRTAPLSRRYGAALARLRRAADSPSPHA